MSLHAILGGLVARDPVLRAVLAAVRDDGLPDAWVCSGALVGLLWNHLTGRPPRHGLKDIDIAYFDPDTGWAAEDRVIRRLARLSTCAGVPVEVRNQARVHLWFPARFGIAYPVLPDACAALRLYPARCFAIAARFGPAGEIELAAPFGLDEAFAMAVRPNAALPNAAAYAAKAARIAALWPEALVAPWSDYSCHPQPVARHGGASAAPR